ncbi:transcriptional regulator, PadR-like family protein [Alkalihalophilus pseudofirmus OF4]|uniref:Transcriptional regulator, PadR-like family protein n=2 Tax=Alkalihalophilus pseudofirmus TaxID=79885 RepID=D3FRI4_ALKPO|nr:MULTISPECIES: helix-turn-helix transcriptional regulator [Alkalihalophilus]ADC51575.1 transcriptional regulator, PadR-like family protein [Alkalihalophilus pseudofirmus OF4]MDV2884795.1 helix-turn-helix transcriptional regulator [Alkalihalophilus pseudofirmus]MED1603364.1 helix-turn-helix transcriptional regulator [Alkalihalophilus marmarensis]
MSMQILVLATLKKKPNHPYEIKQTLYKDGWNKLILITDGNLYQAIRTLTKLDCIREVKSEKENNRPNRTIYELTPTGEKHLQASIVSVFEKQQTDARTLYPALAYIEHADKSNVLQHIGRWMNELSEELNQRKEYNDKINQLIQEHYYEQLELQYNWLKRVNEVLREEDS